MYENIYVKWVSKDLILIYQIVGYIFLNETDLYLSFSGLSFPVLLSECLFKSWDTLAMVLT